MQVIFHRLAAREFRSARHWYAAESSGVASRFHMAVKEALLRVESDYEVLPIIHQAYRWVRVRRFPYILICHQISDLEVVVVAVAHTSRRTGYWRRRQ